MAKTGKLTTSINSLFSKINEIRVNCINAFNEIGMITVGTTKLSEFPNIIRSIKVDDGEFQAILQFNLDWNINPKVPRTGRASDGLTIVHNCTFDYTLNDLYLSDVKAVPDVLFSFKGGYGGLEDAVTISHNALFNNPTILNMKINQIKEELHPNEDTLS